MLTSPEAIMRLVEPPGPSASKPYTDLVLGLADCNEKKNRCHSRTGSYRFSGARGSARSGRAGRVVDDETPGPVGLPAHPLGTPGRDRGGLAVGAGRENDGYLLISLCFWSCGNPWQTGGNLSGKNA